MTTRHGLYVAEMSSSLNELDRRSGACLRPLLPGRQTENGPKKGDDSHTSGLSLGLHQGRAMACRCEPCW